MIKKVTLLTTLGAITIGIAIGAERSFSRDSTALM